MSAWLALFVVAGLLMPCGTLEEAIRLLRNPLGSIPISRPMAVDAPTSPRSRALLLRLGVREP